MSTTPQQECPEVKQPCILIKILKSKWTWISVSLIFIFGISILFFQFNRLLNVAQNQIQTKLESYLAGHQIRLGKLSTNFINTISLSSIEISNPGGFQNGFLLKIPKINLNLKLKGILQLYNYARRKNQPDKLAQSGFASIKIDHPSLYLSRKESKWNLPKIKKGEMSILPLRISWKDAEIKINDDSKKLDGIKLTSISGLLDVQNGLPILELTVRPSQNEKLILKGQLDSAQSFKMQVVGEQVNIGTYLKQFQLVPDSYTFSGNINPSLEFSGAWPLNWEQRNEWKYNGSVKFNPLISTLPLMKRTQNLFINGEVRFSNEKVETESLIIQTSSSEIKLAGMILSPLKEPQIQIQAVSKLQCEEWISSPIKGLAELSFTGVGSIKNPQLKGGLKISNGQAGKLPLTAESDLDFSSMTLEIKTFSATLGDGKMTAKGKFSTKKLNWDMRLEGLSIENFFSNAKNRMNGKLFVQAHGQGNLENPKMKGYIKIKNFVWADRPIGTLSGSIDFSKYFLKTTLISNDKQTNFSLSGEDKGTHYILKQAQLNLSSGENLKISGKIEKNSKKIIGAINAQSVTVSKVAPFIDFLSQFKGKLSLKGQILGTLSDPSLKGSLTGANLSLNSKEASETIGSLSSEMNWTSKSFQLNNVILGDYYKGFFNYWKKPESRFSLKVEVNEGDPKVLFAFMNVTVKISGKLKGQMELSHKKDPHFSLGEPAWEGNGNLSLSAGKWNETHFENIHLKYQIEKTKLAIEELNIRQKEGFMIFRANTEQKQNKNPLTIFSEAKNFILANKKIEGTMFCEGYFHIDPKEWLSGNMKSENFSINTFSAGKLEGELELKDKVLSLTHFSWGDFFKGKGAILFGQKGSPAIRGEWSSSDKKMGEWKTLFLLENLPLDGQMALSGNVSGSLAEPNFVLSSSFSDLQLTQEKKNKTDQEDTIGFAGSGNVILSNGILKRISIEALSQNGGALSLVGQSNLKSQELGIRVLFKDVDSSLYLKPIGIKNLKGKSSGEIDVNGRWKEPTIQGEIRGSEGSIGTIPLDSWEAAGKFQGKEVLFSRLNFFGRKGSWRFSILEDSWVQLKGDQQYGSFRIAMDFANIFIGPAFLVGGGVAEGTWKDSQKSDVPLFQGTLKMNETTINNFELLPINLKLQYENKKIKFLNEPSSNDARNSKNLSNVKGEINFSKLPCVSFKQLEIFDSQTKIFSLDGELCPKNPSFKMEGNEVDASLVAGILESPFTFSGKTRFKVEGLMENQHPQIKGELLLHNGRVERIPIDELYSKFLWKEGTFSLFPARAQHKDYYLLNINGSFPMKWGEIVPQNPKIDLKLDLKNTDLAVLNFLEHNLVKNAKGSTKAALFIKGRPEQLKIDGILEVENGELDSRYLNRKAKNINLKAEIKSNKITLLKSKSEIGNGKLEMSGTLEIVPTVGEIAFNNFNLNLKSIDKSGIPIQVPELPSVQEKLGLPSTPSRGAPRFSIQITGIREKPKIAGWIELEDTLFSYPPPKKTTSASTWIDPVEWDLKIKTGKQTMFQNDFTYAQIKGELNVKGTRENLLINGKINSDEGTITIYGSKFNLREADLEVLQPPTFTLTKESGSTTQSQNVAYLQFKAEQNVDVSINQGTEKIPDTVTIQLERTPLTENFDPQKLTFRSNQNPNLSSEKVAARAGLGINLEGLTPEERDVQLRQGIARLLDAQLASPLARTILQRTGLVHKIEITQETPVGRTQEVRGTESSSLDPLIGQSILVERVFGRKLGVGYKLTFDRIQDRADFIHELQLRYPFYRGILLYGTIGLDSKETLGQEPERLGGLQWKTKFDPADWFKKDKKKDEGKK